MLKKSITENQEQKQRQQKEISMRKEDRKLKKRQRMDEKNFAIESFDVVPFM